MAHSNSAKKRVRQNAKRRLRNRRRKEAVKETVRELDATIEAGDAAGAAEKLKVACKRLDKTAAKGTMHKKTVARRKSRLAKRVNALSS